ncbi:FxSxx-COOH system tetratricopeptide repeat protein [Micromonospora sp. NPDC048947]|uniref:FxSxx-COOH system tetratricopeptide repeat protein n=1 Tax=Micromonospora sp. NPDC048947 TaxID=3154826 RepID=UPI0033CC65C5
MPQLAAWFQDRAAGVDLVRAAKAGRTAALTQVLSGMGGVGKTQLAAQFVRHLESTGEVDVRVWVTASSEDAIVVSYSEAARAVGVALVDADDQSAAQRLMEWFGRTDRRWLVVLDNLDAPGDAARWWPPDSRHGRTIVTTRRRDAVLDTDRRSLVEVDLFTPGEAVAYLRSAIGAGVDQEPELEGLAAELEYLPIAAAQAAAFIRDRAIDASVYRARLADRHKQLADLVPPEDALPDDQRTVAGAIWSLSIDAADSHPPSGLARRVLELAAVLDPNGIPDALFKTDAVTAHLTRISGRDVTTEEVWDALRNLHRLHLVTHDPATGQTRVHALIQRVTRDDLDAPRLRATARTAADGLLEIWPNIDRESRYTHILRENAVVLHACSGGALLKADVHSLLFRNLDSLGYSGQAAAAKAGSERLLAEVLRVLGPNHPGTLATRYHLSHWRGEAGDASGAVTAFERVLIDMLRVLGPEHPYVLATRHTLAYWRGKTGDASGAVAAFEQVLTNILRVRGPDHPNTLATRHNLAYSRGKAGDPSGAVAAFEQVLIDMLRVHGPDHPDTLTTRSTLAGWRLEAGDLSGAVTALEHLLTDRLRVLGPDHPDTLTTRHNLAYWRGEAGDPSGAVAALEQVLTDMLRVRGPDHPSTLAASEALAYWKRKHSGTTGT